MTHGPRPRPRPAPCPQHGAGGIDDPGRLWAARDCAWARARPGGARARARAVCSWQEKEEARRGRPLCSLTPSCSHPQEKEEVKSLALESALVRTALATGSDESLIPVVELLLDFNAPAKKVRFERLFISQLNRYKIDDKHWTDGAQPEQSSSSAGAQLISAVARGANRGTGLCGGQSWRA